jgi:hypothetical protein
LTMLGCVVTVVVLLTIVVMFTERVLLEPCVVMLYTSVVLLTKLGCVVMVVILDTIIVTFPELLLFESSVVMLCNIVVLLTMLGCVVMDVTLDTLPELLLFDSSVVKLLTRGDCVVIVVMLSPGVVTFSVGFESKVVIVSNVVVCPSTQRNNKMLKSK